MELRRDPGKWIGKKARAGFRGHPVGTVICYGPDNRRASKVAVSIIPEAHAEATGTRCWFAETGDIRKVGAVLAEITAFLRDQQVRSVVMKEGVFGCPHEEGIDYPSGEACPQCPYWTGRDRWTGEVDGERAAMLARLGLQT
jgi:hypothetical protein